MWDEIEKYLPVFESAVLNVADAEGYPYSVRCRPRPTVPPGSYDWTPRRAWISDSARPACCATATTSTRGTRRSSSSGEDWKRTGRMGFPSREVRSKHGDRERPGHGTRGDRDAA